MPEIIAQNLPLLEHLSYLGIFLLVAMSGHMLPVPQDISLISVGYLIALNYISFWPALLVGSIAPITSDLFLFYLSTVGSRFAPKPEKYSRTWLFQFAMHHMHENTILTVMLMRLVTGSRFMSPVMGAYMGVPIKKYLIANSISAAVFGPLFILLGFVFHEKITLIINVLKSFEHLGLAVFIVVVLGIIGYFVKNRYNISDAEE